MTALLSADARHGGAAVYAGCTFVDDNLPELGWRPGCGQTWDDAPKALMRVTAVRHGKVTYTYAGQPTGVLWFMPEDDFRRRYSEPLAPPPSTLRA